MCYEIGSLLHLECIFETSTCCETDPLLHLKPKWQCGPWTSRRSYELRTAFIVIKHGVPAHTHTHTHTHTLNKIRKLFE